MEFLLFGGVLAVVWVLYRVAQPLHAVGLRKLKHELRNRRMELALLDDNCLKEVVTLAERPEALPKSLGFFARRAQFVRNVELLANSVARILGEARHPLDYEEPLVKILRKYNHIQ